MGTTKESEMTGTFESRKAAVVAKVGMAEADAFEMAVRSVTAESIARTLRAVAGDPDYGIGKMDPEMVRRIADEVSRMY